MIEHPNLLLVGRREFASEQNRWLFERLLDMCERIRDAWQTRWPDRIAEWDEWNVLAAIGPWGRWDFFDLLTWENLGTSPVPHLVRRWRYVPMIGLIDPADVGADPPILYDSSRVLNIQDWPVKLAGTWKKNPKIRLEAAEKELRDLSLHLDPSAQTQAGVNAALRLRGLELVPPLSKQGVEERGVARWRVRPVKKPRTEPTRSARLPVPWNTLHEGLRT